MNFGRRPSRSSRSSVSSSRSIAHAVGVHVDLHDVAPGRRRRSAPRRGRWAPRPRSRRRGRSASWSPGRSPAGRRWSRSCRRGRPACPRRAITSRDALLGLRRGPRSARTGAPSRTTRRRSAARSAAKVSGGKVLVSGRPPASEITSGRAVTAIRSRIAEDFMTARARGEEPGVALEVARERRAVGRSWSVVYVPPGAYRPSDRRPTIEPRSRHRPGHRPRGRERGAPVPAAAPRGRARARRRRRRLRAAPTSRSSSRPGSWPCSLVARASVVVRGRTLRAAERSAGRAVDRRAGVCSARCCSPARSTDGRPRGLARACSPALRARRSAGARRAASSAARARGWRRSARGTARRSTPTCSSLVHRRARDRRCRRSRSRALVAFVVLPAARRSRREGEKYEGLRILQWRRAQEARPRRHRLAQAGDARPGDRRRAAPRRCRRSWSAASTSATACRASPRSRRSPPPRSPPGAGPGPPPHPVDELVPPRRGALRRVRLVVRGHARVRHPCARSTTRSTT